MKNVLIFRSAIYLIAVSILILSSNACSLKKTHSNTKKESVKLIKATPKKTKNKKSQSKVIKIENQNQKTETKRTSESDEIIVQKEDDEIFIQEEHLEIDSSEFIKILKENGIEIDSHLASSR